MQSQTIVQSAIAKALAQRSIAQILVGVSLLQVLTGCAPTKAIQCNTLAVNVNQSSVLGKKLETFGNDLGTKFGKAKNIEEYQAVAKETVTATTGVVSEIDQFIKGVAAVKLEDQTLIGLRDRAVKNYGVTVTSLNEMSGIFKEISTFELKPETAQTFKSRLESLKTVMEKMSSVDAEEQKIASEFNTYCGVTPAK